MDDTQVAAQQDTNRTARMFLAALQSSLGNDQTYAQQDGNAVNLPRQYQTIGINGAVGVEGAPISNAQGKAVAMSPGILLLGALVLFFVLKKG